MGIPYFLLRLLPLFEYICPKCRKEVKVNSHECPHCGEKYPVALRVPPSFLKDSKKLEAYVHEYVFPRISEFERNYLTQYFTTYFSDDFESGNFTSGGWTLSYASGGTTGTVQSTTKYAGTYAAKFPLASQAGAYSVAIKALGANYTTLYSRAYIQFSATPASGNYLMVTPDVMDAYGYDVTCAYIHNASGTLKWCLEYWAGTSHTQYFVDDATGANVATNTWYCVEIQCTLSAGSGIVRLWVNGVQLVSVTGLTSGFTALTQLQVGGASPAALAVNVYVDNVIVADAFIPYNVSVTDSLGLSDSILRNKTLSVADSVGASDALLRNKTFTLTDAVGLADALLRNKTLAVTDSVGSSDSVLGNKVPLITVDTVILTDALLRNKQFAVADSISLSDALYRHKALVAILDSVGVLDSVQRNKLLQLLDTLSLEDQVLASKLLLVADVVLLSDLVNVLTEQIIKAVVDTVGLADQVLANKSVAVADAVGVLDAVLRHKPSVSVSDIVGALDAVLVSKVLMVADSVSLAEVAAVLKTLNLSDALSLVDAVGVPSRVLRVLDAVCLADGAFVNKALQVTDAICLVEVVWAGKRRETALYLVVGNLVVNLKTGKVDFALS